MNKNYMILLLEQGMIEIKNEMNYNYKGYKGYNLC